MSNRFMGEVSITVDAKTYILRMDMNAMCEFEDMTGQDPMAVFAKAEKPDAKISMPIMRKIIHASLLRHHPDANVMLAGDILSEDPGIVGRLIAAAAPEPEGDAKPEGKGKAGGKRGT